MSHLRRWFVASILFISAFVVPFALQPIQQAGATSPLGCRTDHYWNVILCYQIQGPNHTDLVNTFYYTEQNVGRRVQWIDVEISGPSGLWGPVLDIVYPYRFQSGGIFVHHYVLPGNYCIHFFSRYHVNGWCYSVHPW